MSTTKHTHTTAQEQTRRIDALLEEYGESHRDPRNKLIHWVCVPAITWCVLMGFYLLPYPQWLGAGAGLNWMWVFLVASLLYYIRLSVPLAVGFVAVAGVCVALLEWLERATTIDLAACAGLVFVLAWIGQFIGHKIEGKKPSFFKDLQLLLVGPAWLLAFVYKRLGIAY